MTVRTPPTFLQAGSHTAENTRLAQAGFFGAFTSSFAGGVGAGENTGHGVQRVGAQLEVSENGTPNMSVNVAAGGCFIRGTESASQGTYHFYNDATVNLSISAADPTNARWDLVVAQVRDAGYSGADDDARLFVVEGTPAGSPADPTLPENCLVLARVVVGAGVSSITDANITDLRTYARPWNTAWGTVGLATRTSGQTISSTSATDLTGLSVTFTAVGFRRYRVQAWVRAGGSSTTAGSAELLLTDGSNTQLQQDRYGNIDATSDRFTLSILYFATPSAGSVTYKLRARDATATKNWQTIAAANNPAYLVVEDIGPA